jgi:Cof subfamily protein (haloacid dehalogenase superfamily)
MKYLFLDVDGTLYSSQIADVPISARRALSLAQAGGSRIFLCTGRSLAECTKYLNMGFDGFVFGAGAMIYAGGKRIYDEPLEPGQVKEIQAFLEKFNFGWSLEGQAGAYCDERGYEYILPYFSGRNTPRSVMIQQCMDNGCYPVAYMDPREKIYKVCGFTENTQVDLSAMRAQLPKAYSLTVSLVSENDTTCEMMNGAINKGTGLARVLDYYGARAEDAVAIGDSDNDIPMLKKAGTGIAMGNAFPSVKEAADWITTDILDDGIWNAFRHVGVI